LASTFEFARRAQNRGAAELQTILAGPPPGALSMSGGFPNPDTFPTEDLDQIVAKLLRDEPGVALQYAPSEGIPSVREYLIDRQEHQQGRRPAPEELTVTSGGMECIALLCQALLEPGDMVAVEAPTYLGALMAFANAEAEVVGIPLDSGGLVVEALAERLDAGARPKFLYVIPEYQNPSGWTLALDRREVLIDLCRRHGVLIVEDVAYREMAFDTDTVLPSLWSLAPDVVLQAGTFSKIFCPGVRLGWAAGPAAVVEQLAAAKQLTDQCAGGLGQRMVEEYGRAGHFGRRLPHARELYASHWRALSAALERELGDVCTWSEPTGGFFSWLTLPEGLDSVELRSAAVEAGVTYVPGPPFYADGGGHRELRLSFSHLGADEYDEAVRRLASVLRA
jgi:2-aminoadipate transaminase